MNNNINLIVKNTIIDFNKNSTIPININEGNSAPIFGCNGPLDSFGLVSLLVSIEDQILDQLDISLTIADERALSQKNSPFSTVKTLVLYLENLISEVNNSE